MGRTAVPRVSVAPLLACNDSIRPMPASRFQLTPHVGWALAIIRSALRYACSAIDGMPSAPGEFTTMEGGGADIVAAAATWKLVGGRLTGTTDGPGRASASGTAAV